MRALAATVAGVATHVGVFLGIVALAHVSGIFVSMQDLLDSEPMSSAEAAALWAGSLAICIVPALVSGIVVSRIARKGWTIAAFLVGLAAAWQSPGMLIGATMRGHNTLIIVGMLVSLITPMLAASIWRRRDHAAAF